MRILKFEYRVRDRQSRLKKGILEADNHNMVVESLLDQGYYILLLKEARQSGPDININFTFDNVTTRDLVVLTRQLATMIAAGLPIIRCFDILKKQTANKRLRQAIAEVQNDIETGLALWEAIAKHPDIFSSIYISMVKAGELGGVLETVLERLSEHLEREQEVNSKVKAASIYPIIISMFAVLVAFFIITFVMPTFVDMFQSTQVELPLPTRVLLTTGTAFKKTWMYFIPGIVILIAALIRWGKTTAGRMFYDYGYLHLPVIGKTVSRIIVARFARTMGTLIRAGIPILQALEIVEEVVGNVIISRAINKARAAIRDGESIAGPLVDAGVFEPMVIDMIAVGEETGTLDDMLLRISDYFEREAMHMIDSMMAVLEPILIFAVAIIVGGVVVATLLPIFEIINVVGV
ncbi:MAG: type II secretion system F family protein [Syntrophomonas sp.]